MLNWIAITGIVGLFGITIHAWFALPETIPRLLTLYPFAHKDSYRKCVDYFCGKTAGTAVFPQTKKNTNNFPQNPLKAHKVNSLDHTYPLWIRWKSQRLG
jgi:hypothetical protein